MRLRCRELMAASESPHLAAFFYVSFFLVVAMVLINVVIAVLLVCIDPTYLPIDPI